MGVIKRGILGGFSGKVGNVIGTSWKGIAVMKSMPLSVANPRTAKQIEQRTKQTNIVSFATRILSGVIKPLWDRFAQGMSGYNAFVSANIALFVDFATLNPFNVKLSVGKMAATDIVAVTRVAGTKAVTVTWDNAISDPYAQQGDVAYVVVFNVTQNVIAYEADILVSRESAETTVTMPTNLASSDKLDIWLSFKRTDGTVVSDSFGGAYMVS